MVNCEKICQSKTAADSWEIPILRLELQQTINPGIIYHIWSTSTINYKESIFEERPVVYVETTFCTDFKC